MKAIFTIAAVLIISVILITANHFLDALSFSISTNTFADKIFKYQLLLLCIALLVVTATLLITKDSLTFLQFGQIDTIAQKENWLGINGKDTWRKNSFYLAFFISFATGLFMFLALKSTGSLNSFSWHFIPFVVLFSCINSFSEEIIYRFVVIGNLHAILSKSAVIILSALLFGLPHYFGAPSGVIGIIMSFALGYILAKATYETNGIGIACAIHFIQDLIIFTALFMMNNKT